MRMEILNGWLTRSVHPLKSQMRLCREFFDQFDPNITSVRASLYVAMIPRQARCVDVMIECMNRSAIREVLTWDWLETSFDQFDQNIMGVRASLQMQWIHDKLVVMTGLIPHNEVEWERIETSIHQSNPNKQNVKPSSYHTTMFDKF
jgi:hypothetical protein